MDLIPHAVCSAGLVLAGLCPAQDPTLTAESTVGVFTSTPTNTQTASVPPGTLTEFATSETVSTPLGSLPRMTASFTSLDHGDSVDLRGNATCFSSFHSPTGVARTGTSDGNGVFSPVSWLWFLPGSRNGVVRLRSSAETQGFFALFDATIDVGADGTVEATVSGGHETLMDFPISTTASGISVRVTLQSRVQATLFSGLFPGGDFVDYSVGLSYIATGGLTPPVITEIHEGAVACGADLFLREFPVGTRHEATYTARINEPGSTTWLLLGLAPIGPAPLPIPGGTDCLLEIDPIVVLPNTANPIGDSTWSISIPGPIVDMSLFAQAASLHPLATVFTTSSSLRAAFDD